MLVSEATVMTPRGAVPVRELEGGEEVLALTGERRPSWIRLHRIRTRRHQGAVMQIEVDGASLCATPDQVLFGRMKDVADLHDLVLVQWDERGYYLGVLPGTHRGLVEPRIVIVEGRGSRRVGFERLWILSSFKSSRQAVWVKRFVSLKYGLPTMRLESRLRSRDPDPDMCWKLLGEIETRSRARRLLETYQMSEIGPHVVRRIIDPEDRGAMRVTEVPYLDPEITPRRAVTETERLLREEAGRADGFHVRRLSVPGHRLGFSFWAAGHLRPGMSILELDGKAWKLRGILEAGIVPYQGEVFSLETPCGSPLVVDGFLIGQGGTLPG